MSKKLDFLAMDSEAQRSYTKHLESLASDRGTLAYATSKGRAEGEMKGKIETAMNLKSLGVDLAIISKSTGLSIDEIEKL